MRRVFVICDCKFPRGGALANYIQYLLLAIQKSGYETILICDINQEYIKNRKEHIKYNQFVIEVVPKSKNRVVRHFQYKNGFVKDRISALKRNKISGEDVVIVFGQDKIFYKKLLLYKKHIGFKIIGGILEMFDRDSFAGNKFQFEKYQYVINHILPEFDIVMPISTYIENFYKQRLVRTVCLPIMADYREFEVIQKTFEKARFILPANGRMKDSLSTMLKAFASLSPNELDRVELHLCGLSESTVKDNMAEEEYDQLCSKLIIHGWMKYEELINLYQKMNFLVLAREVSQMTLANFPSKVPETMTFGIVPIVSEVGDYTKYYLRDGVDSIFMRGCSIEICREAIQKALNLSEGEYKKLSNNAMDCVKKRFDYYVWTDIIRDMLESV